MDIAIIGAGPAGLSCANELVKGGYSVTLFEKGKVGENIVCAEGLFDYFGKLNLTLPDEMKVKKLIIEGNNKYNITIPTSSKFSTFDRSKWQKYLAEKAIKNGLKVFENKKIEKADLNYFKKHFKYVIDASGVRAVSHIFFPKNEVKKYRKNFVPAVQYTVNGDFECYKETIKAVIFDDPPGYFWLFPKKKENGYTKANIGLGYLSKQKSLPNLKHVLERMTALEGIDTQDLKINASPIPTKRLKQYVSDNIILTGDALGLCSPLHGGGIDTAYLSGYYVAQSIIKGNFKIYEKFLKDIYKRYFLESIFLSLWLNFGSKNVLNRLKNKGLFKEKPHNIPLTGPWLIKALFRLII